VTRYWIGVASKSHVVLGVAGGFAQLNHGKKAPLQKLKAGDWLIFYSPRLELESREPLQCFTAIGRVKTGEVYQHELGSGFSPYRVDVDFLACREVSIASLFERLSFVPDKRHWGYRFRFGHLEVPSQTSVSLLRRWALKLSRSRLRKCSRGYGTIEYNPKRRFSHVAQSNPA
jgi:hypothetical protein